jgi:hypothetical protein
VGIFFEECVDGDVQGAFERINRNLIIRIDLIVEHGLPSLANHVAKRDVVLRLSSMMRRSASTRATRAI